MRVLDSAVLDMPIFSVSLAESSDGVLPDEDGITVDAVITNHLPCVSNQNTSRIGFCQLIHLAPGAVHRDRRMPFEVYESLRGAALATGRYSGATARQEHAYLVRSGKLAMHLI
jgi:hypothetical protein